MLTHGPRRAALHAIAPELPSADSAPEVAIYSRPELYDLAFSYRELKTEVAFLRAAYKKHAKPRHQALQAALDLGCGPGAHVLALAAAGVEHAVGLDSSRTMVQYATAQAGAGSPAAPTSRKGAPGAATFVVGDMRRVAGGLGQAASPVPAQFDMVTCLLGTMSHMLTNADAAAVLRGAADALRPGGLFIIELGHPGDLFDGSLYDGSGVDVWEVAAGPQGTLFVEWGAETDEFDVVKQVIQRTVTISLRKGDEVVQSIEDVVPARQFTVQEIELLASSAGLDVRALYGDLSIGKQGEFVGMSHPDAHRLVAVLAKPLVSPGSS